MEVGPQPAVAEDPVSHDRVDESGEDDREDDVDAELNPLQRRSPDDRQRDRAEGELEPPERLDRDSVGVARPSKREVLRVTYKPSAGAD